MDKSPVGSVTDVSFVLEKAPLLITSTLSGISIVSIPLPRKADIPIVRRPSGSVILLHSVRFVKASFPISVTFLPETSEGTVSSVSSPS